LLQRLLPGPSAFVGLDMAQVNLTSGSLTHVRTPKIADFLLSNEPSLLLSASQSYSPCQSSSYTIESVSTPACGSISISSSSSSGGSSSASSSYDQICSPDSANSASQTLSEEGGSNLPKLKEILAKLEAASGDETEMHQNYVDFHKEFQTKGWTLASGGSDAQVYWQFVHNSFSQFIEACLRDAFSDNVDLAFAALTTLATLLHCDVAQRLPKKETEEVLESVINLYCTMECDARISEKRGTIVHTLARVRLQVEYMEPFLPRILEVLADALTTRNGVVVSGVIQGLVLDAVDNLLKRMPIQMKRQESVDLWAGMVFDRLWTDPRALRPFKTAAHLFSKEGTPVCLDVAEKLHVLMKEEDAVATRLEGEKQAEKEQAAEQAKKGKRKRPSEVDEERLAQEKKGKQEEKKFYKYKSIRAMQAMEMGAMVGVWQRCVLLLGPVLDKSDLLNPLLELALPAFKDKTVRPLMAHKWMSLVLVISRNIKHWTVQIVEMCCYGLSYLLSVHIFVTSSPQQSKSKYSGLLMKPLLHYLDGNHNKTTCAHTSRDAQDVSANAKVTQHPYSLLLDPSPCRP
jgi:hypothetical protein